MTENQYENALMRIYDLIQLTPLITVSEYAELDNLAREVEEYELQCYPIK